MTQDSTVVDQATRARRLLRSVSSGVLSTMSLELPGYPFGSLTPFVTTREGVPVVYVSSIAQHTRNLLADPRVSLTVVEPGGGNQQALGRVTVVGDAAEVSADERAEVAARYFRFFPEAEGYAGTHDFAFYSIDVRRVRYIGGFGQIFWVEPEDWQLPTPEWGGNEQGILDHMNTDHLDALERMAGSCGAAVEAGSTPTLVAVDSEGTHLRCGGAVHYLPFRAAALDSDGVRRAMIELSRSA